MRLAGMTANQPAPRPPRPASPAVFSPLPLRPVAPVPLGTRNSPALGPSSCSSVDGASPRSVSPITSPTGPLSPAPSLSAALNSLGSMVGSAALPGATVTPPMLKAVAAAGVTVAAEEVLPGRTSVSAGDDGDDADSVSDEEEAAVEAILAPPSRGMRGSRTGAGASATAGRGAGGLDIAATQSLSSTDGEDPVPFGSQPAAVQAGAGVGRAGGSGSFAPASRPAGAGAERAGGAVATAAAHKRRPGRPPMNFALALALQRRRMARHVIRLARRARLPLPAMPYRMAYHAFGTKYFITPAGCTLVGEEEEGDTIAGTPRQAAQNDVTGVTPLQGPSPAYSVMVTASIDAFESQQESQQQQQPYPNGSTPTTQHPKGLFSFHRMIAYRIRVLQVISRAAATAGCTLPQYPPQPTATNPAMDLTPTLPTVPAIPAPQPTTVVLSKDLFPQMALTSARARMPLHPQPQPATGALSAMQQPQQGSVSLLVRLAGTNLQYCRSVSCRVVVGQGASQTVLPGLVLAEVVRQEGGGEGGGSAESGLGGVKWDGGPQTQGLAPHPVAGMWRHLRGAVASFLPMLGHLAPAPQPAHSQHSHRSSVVVRVTLTRTAYEAVSAAATASSTLVRLRAQGAQGAASAAPPAPASMELVLRSDFQELRTQVALQPFTVGVLGLSSQAASALYTALATNTPDLPVHAFAAAAAAVPGRILRQLPSALSSLWRTTCGEAADAYAATAAALAQAPLPTPSSGGAQPGNPAATARPIMGALASLHAAAPSRMLSRAALGLPWSRALTAHRLPAAVVGEGEATPSTPELAPRPTATSPDMSGRRRSTQLLCRTALAAVAASAAVAGVSHMVPLPETSINGTQAAAVAAALAAAAARATTSAALASPVGDSMPAAPALPSPTMGPPPLVQQAPDLDASRPSPSGPKALFTAHDHIPLPQSPSPQRTSLDDTPSEPHAASAAGTAPDPQPSGSPAGRVYPKHRWSLWTVSAPPLHAEDNLDAATPDGSGNTKLVQRADSAPSITAVGAGRRGWWAARNVGAAPRSRAGVGRPWVPLQLFSRLPNRWSPMATAARQSVALTRRSSGGVSDARSGTDSSSLVSLIAGGALVLADVNAAAPPNRKHPYALLRDVARGLWRQGAASVPGWWLWVRGSFSLLRPRVGVMQLLHSRRQPATSSSDEGEAPGVQGGGGSSSGGRDLIQWDGLVVTASADDPRSLNLLTSRAFNTVVARATVARVCLQPVVLASPTTPPGSVLTTVERLAKACRVSPDTARVVVVVPEEQQGGSAEERGGAGPALQPPNPQPPLPPPLPTRWARQDGAIGRDAVGVRPAAASVPDLADSSGMPAGNEVLGVREVYTSLMDMLRNKAQAELGAPEAATPPASTLPQQPPHDPPTEPRSKL